MQGKKKLNEIKEDADGHKRGFVFFFRPPLFVLCGASSYPPGVWIPSCSYQVNKRHHGDQTIKDMQASKRLARGTDALDALNFSRIFIAHPWRPTRQMVGQATMDTPLGLRGLLRYAYIRDRLPLEGPG